MTDAVVDGVTGIVYCTGNKTMRREDKATWQVARAGGPIPSFISAPSVPAYGLYLE